MDAVKMPAVLTWDKQKAAFSKMKSPPPLKDPLDKVQRAYDAVKWAELNADKLSTPAEAEKRLAELERAKALIKTLNDRAGDAKKACDDAKKDKSVPPDAAKALEAMSKATAQLQSDANDFVDGARKAIQAELDKLAKAAKSEKAEKDKQAPAGSGGKLPVSKELKFVKGKTLECLRKIKAPQPGAKPWRFIVAKGSASVGACFMQTAPGNAQANMLKKLMPGEKVQVIKDPKGEVIWENKAVTLVTAMPVQGIAKKLQVFLKKVTNINIKIRVRTPTGETLDEDATFKGDELSDDALKPDAEEAAENERAGKEFATELGKLKGSIQKALASNLSKEDREEIQGYIKSLQENGAARRYQEASEDLSNLKEALEALATGGGGDDGGLSVKEIQEVRAKWAQERDKAIKEIKRLAEAIVKEFAAEKDQLPQVRKAVTDLYALADKQLKADLEHQLDAAASAKDAAARAQAVSNARRALQEMQSLLDSHPVMRELDGNEILSDMRVVAPMKQTLSAVEAALG